MRDYEAFIAAKISKRLRFILNLMLNGETLCLTIIHTPEGNEIREYHLEPSQMKVGHSTAYRAITSGFVASNGDGMIDTPQTWRWNNG